MYAPLAGISERVLRAEPASDSRTTRSRSCRPNQRFIESYLVGLNHEFARELLWREYPTDQRGSVFRQFWDVSTYVDREGRDAKALTEALKDIPKIHSWGADSPLGGHNQRDMQGDQAQVVLVDSRRSPRSAIRTPSFTRRRRPGAPARAKTAWCSADETGELYVTNPKDERLRFPLYRAHVAPDIHFIGFDLTLADVKGDARLAETAQARALAGTQYRLVLRAPGDGRRAALRVGYRCTDRTGSVPLGQSRMDPHRLRGRTAHRCRQAVHRGGARRPTAASAGAPTPPTWRRSSIRSRSWSACTAATC